MKKTKANRSEYKNSYRKHYHTYKNGKSLSYRSKQLILVYCVECGLKYRLMEQECIFHVTDARNDLQDVLYSHNIDKMLKLIKITAYRFPPFKTKHGDEVKIENYHQICRYAIEVQSQDEIQLYSKQLMEIADLLNERI